MLVVLLLAAGLLGLLALNTALNEGSFELSRLQRQTTTLTDEQQGLQHQIDQGAAPDALERRARELGMVPGGGMAFLQPDGTVVGKPGPAQDSPPVKRSTAEPWQPAQPRPGQSTAPATPAPAPAPTGDGTVQINPLPSAGTAPQTPAPSTSPAAPVPSASRSGGAAR
ncbi:FtsB family cell division protein [Kitasatospora sp. NPDC004240]